MYTETTEYVDTIEELKNSVDRIYHHCTIMDKPVCIQGFTSPRNTFGIMHTGGIKYGHYTDDTETVRTTLTMFSTNMMFDLSDSLNWQLLEDGFLVEGIWFPDDIKFFEVSHRFSLLFDNLIRVFHGRMSDEEAVIQGFRHGAMEIMRVPQRTKGISHGEIKIYGN